MIRWERLYKSQLFKFVILILILMFGFQWGLSLRTYLRQPLKISSTKNPILLIGDSILGGDDHPQSLSSYIKKNLSLAGLNTIVLSKPALTTNEILGQIDNYIRQYSPSLIVLLLGKRDLIKVEEDKEFKKFNWLNKNIKLFSFLQQESLLSIQKFLLNINLIWNFLVENKVTKKATCCLESCDFTEFSQVFKNCTKKIVRLQNEKETQKSLQLISDIQSNYSSKLNEEQGVVLDILRAQSLGQAGEYKEALLLLSTHREKMKSFPQTIINNYISTLRILRDNEETLNFINDLPAEKKEHPAIYFYQGWALYNNEGCGASISSFEKAYLLGAKTEGPIAQLISCYHETQQLDRGIEYFERLEKERNDLKKTSVAKAVLYGLKGNLEKANQIFKDFSEKNPELRSTYKTRLFLKSKINNREMLEQEFINQSPFQIREGSFISFANYNKLLNRIKNYQTPVLVLQYPNEHEGILKVGLEETEIFSMRQTIIGLLNKYQLEELFELDMEHLTPLGACLSATEVAEFISSKYFSKNTSFDKNKCKEFVKIN